jgi:hypothetical protein
LPEPIRNTTRQSTIDSIEKARIELAFKTPDAVFHHYVTGDGPQAVRTGLKGILESKTLLAGEGVAPYGGGSQVRANMGPAAGPFETPVIDFRVADPSVRGRVGRFHWMGQKPTWATDLPIKVTRVTFPDGAVAVPDGAGGYTLTPPGGAPIPNQTAAQLAAYQWGPK